MIEPLIYLTGIVLLFSMARAYFRTRDPFHPMLYLGLMMLYVYVYVPLVFVRRGELARFFRSEEDIEFAVLLTLLGVALFCIGCLQPRIARKLRDAARTPLQLSPAVRSRLITISYVLGGIGVVAYFHALSLKGGLVSAYSAPKGGGWSASGYVSSAYLLTIPALMLYLVGRGRRKMDGKTLFVLALFMSPHVIHGLLSASRGTTFLAFATLVFGWYLSMARRPSIQLTVGGFAAVGLLMLFLKTYRSEIYIGSDFQIEKRPLIEIVAPATGTVGDTSIFSYGLITVSRFHNHHFWGKRLFVQIIVRAVPKQIWPTKYEDTGMSWMVTDPGSSGLSNNRWIEALGWLPDRGSAAGFVADSFLEFSWGGLLACYLIGLFYGFLWRRALIHKGLWTVLYFEAAVVSVYLPTQSLISAWLFRLLFLALPTLLLAWIVRFRWSEPRRKKLAAEGRKPPKLVEILDFG